ncbi:MAG: GerAB/ArcD/ProY family transporter [Clostridia bacterium]|nr:GerAB/ArcD/ProY family transporter [Clostridia bacterium]
MFTVSVLLRGFSEGLKIIFFPKTTVPTIMLLFLITMMITNKLGINSLIQANLFFMPLILFSILFVFIANLGNFTFERMLPLFGNGCATTFFSGLSNLFAFSGISFLYLLPPYLKEQKKFQKISLASMGISAIFLILSVMTLLCLFPLAATSEEVFPLYLASRYVQFGRFFQRLDAIFLLIWIISFVSHLSITLYLSTTIFQKITNLQYNKWFSSLFAILVFAFGLLPKNLQELGLLENHVYQYTILVLVFSISLLLLILANLKYYFIQKKKGAIAIDKT